MEVTRGRGYVYALEYHIVWCVKYRRKVLTPDVEKALLEILKTVAIECKFRILEANADLDHIHLLISTSPQTHIPDIIKAMKGKSGRQILARFPEVRSKLWDGHLWNPSYFIATVSDQTEKQIRDYIQSQKER